MSDPVSESSEVTITRHVVREASQGREAEYYDHRSDDPMALTVACPVCPAQIGTWCGGFGDVHGERADLVK